MNTRPVRACRVDSEDRPLLPWCKDQPNATPPFHIRNHGCGYGRMDQTHRSTEGETCHGQERKTPSRHLPAGLNCAQSVLLAFAEELGLDPEKGLKMASSFGGGMGAMGLTCGAVTGALSWSSARPRVRLQRRQSPPRKPCTGRYRGLPARVHRGPRLHRLPGTPRVRYLKPGGISRGPREGPFHTLCRNTWKQPSSSSRERWDGEH